MMKLKILLNKRRQHYLNRLNLRGGTTLPFLFAKVIDKKQVLDGADSECLVWRYGSHIYITQNNQLQTYIKK